MKLQKLLLLNLLVGLACTSQVESQRDTSIKAEGEWFTVDSVQYAIDKYYFSEKDSLTELKVFGRIKNLSKQNKPLDSTYFILEDDRIKPNRFTFTTCLPSTLMDSTGLYLQYILPPRTLPYLKYTLPFREKGDTVKKAQFIFFKSFRAEG